MLLQSLSGRSSVATAAGRNSTQRTLPSRFSEAGTATRACWPVTALGTSSFSIRAMGSQGRCPGGLTRDRFSALGPRLLRAPSPRALGGFSSRPRAPSGPRRWATVSELLCRLHPAEPTPSSVTSIELRTFCLWEAVLRSGGSLLTASLQRRRHQHFNLISR